MAKSRGPIVTYLGNKLSRADPLVEVEQRLKVEELRLKVRDLRRPVLAKFSTWTGSLALLVAVAGVIGQNILSSIKSERAQLDLKEAQIKKDSAVKEVAAADSAVAVATNKRSLAERDFSKYQSKVDSAKQYLATLQSFAASLGRQNGKSSFNKEQLSYIDTLINKSQSTLNNAQPTGIANTGCHPIKVSDIPDFSPNNRYFSADLARSFILRQGSFAVYLAGSGDGYIWDSLKYCDGEYVFHYQRGLPQESSLHGDVYAEIHRRSFTLLSSMGIFAPGKYELLFDRRDNIKTDLVPARDTGRWHILQGGNTYQVMVIKRGEVGFGPQSDSSHLERYKIDGVRIDREDNAELLELTALGPGSYASGTSAEIIIKRGLKNDIILFGLKDEAQWAPTHWLRRP